MIILLNQKLLSINCLIISIVKSALLFYPVKFELNSDKKTEIINNYNEGLSTEEIN